mmetsp:Transcript_3673/g.11169  ORF Transcript_3673/g.11169 Transcript_3673/m.11169 type:complete len:214 (-) Transcript_3673:98-739(-)
MHWVRLQTLLLVLRLLRRANLGEEVVERERALVLQIFLPLRLGGLFRGPRLRRLLQSRLLLRLSGLALRLDGAFLGVDGLALDGRLERLAVFRDVARLQLNRAPVRRLRRREAPQSELGGALPQMAFHPRRRELDALLAVLERLGDGVPCGEVGPGAVRVKDVVLWVQRNRFRVRLDGQRVFASGEVGVAALLCGLGVRRRVVLRRVCRGHRP